MKNRPLSPFMIGPYYRPQLTSVLSIMHRATGVFLSLVGTPLIMWWLMAINGGEQTYQSAGICLSGVAGQLLGVACLFSLSFHFFNGIRHLVWDGGYMLDIRNAYLTGWLVLSASLVSTALLFGVLV